MNRIAFFNFVCFKTSSLFMLSSKLRFVINMEQTLIHVHFKFDRHGKLEVLIESSVRLNFRIHFCPLDADFLYLLFYTFFVKIVFYILNFSNFLPLLFAGLTYKIRLYCYIWNYLTFRVNI